LLRERLRAFIQSPSGTLEAPVSSRLSEPPNGEERAPAQSEFAPRNSNGLDQFFSYIKGVSGLSILDLAGVNQANVSFITNLGHKIYSEDFLRSVRLSANGDPHPRPEAFFKHNLNHPDDTFDGALVWDVLEYLNAPMLTATVDRLSRIVKPGSYVFAVFQAQEKVDSVPQYTFRIKDSKTLMVAERGRRKPEQVFNNRSLEKLFHDFESLKFFLARDKLREVIVRR